MFVGPARCGTRVWSRSGFFARVRGLFFHKLNRIPKLAKGKQNHTSTTPWFGGKGYLQEFTLQSQHANRITHYKYTAPWLRFPRYFSFSFVKIRDLPDYTLYLLWNPTSFSYNYGNKTSFLKPLKFPNIRSGSLKVQLVCDFIVIERERGERREERGKRNPTDVNWDWEEGEEEIIIKGKSKTKILWIFFLFSFSFHDNETWKTRREIKGRGKNMKRKRRRRGMPQLQQRKLLLVCPKTPFDLSDFWV